MKKFEAKFECALFGEQYLHWETFNLKIAEIQARTYAHDEGLSFVSVSEARP